MLAHTAGSAPAPRTTEPGLLPPAVVLKKRGVHANLWAPTEMLATAQYPKIIVYIFLSDIYWVRRGTKKDMCRMAHLGPRHTKEQQR